MQIHSRKTLYRYRAVTAREAGAEAFPCRRYCTGRKCRTGQAERAQGGCLGTRSRRKTRQAAISCGEEHMSRDPQISEWGNPRGEDPRIRAPIHNARRGTRRTETSK